LFTTLHLALNSQVARAAASASAFALGFFPSHNLTNDGINSHVSEEDELLQQLMGHPLPVAGVTKHNLSTKWVRSRCAMPAMRYRCRRFEGLLGSRFQSSMGSTLQQLDKFIENIRVVLLQVSCIVA
jgi:hypothetical protein